MGINKFRFCRNIANLKLDAVKKSIMVPYAEIGASFQQ